MTPKRRPSIGPLASFRLAADVMCSRGMTRRCTGALGVMSRNAMTWSSSKTMSAGISIAAIRQKRQSSLGIVAMLSRVQSWGLVIIRKAITPTNPAIT